MTIGLEDTITKETRMANLRGDRLRGLRERRGWTQEELADEIGYTNKQVSRWESGSSDISTDALVKLSKLFGVTSDWLLGLVDDPNERYQESELSPIERRILDAFRSGRLAKVLEILGLAFKEDKSGVDRPSKRSRGGDASKREGGNNGHSKGRK